MDNVCCVLTFGLSGDVSVPGAVLWARRQPEMMRRRRKERRALQRPDGTANGNTTHARRANYRNCLYEPVHSAAPFFFFLWRQSSWRSGGFVFRRCLQQLLDQLLFSYLCVHVWVFACANVLCTVTLMCRFWEKPSNSTWGAYGFVASGLKMQCHRNEVINLCLLRQQMQLHLAKSLFFLLLLLIRNGLLLLLWCIFINLGCCWHNKPGRKNLSNETAYPWFVLRRDLFKEDFATITLQYLWSIFLHTYRKLNCW